MAAIPVLILYNFVQRYVIEGGGLRRRFN